MWDVVLQCVVVIYDLYILKHSVASLNGKGNATVWVSRIEEAQIQRIYESSFSAVDGMSESEIICGLFLSYENT